MLGDGDPLQPFPPHRNASTTAAESPDRRASPPSKSTQSTVAMGSGDARVGSVNFAFDPE